MSPLAPIVLFAYNRPHHLRRAVEALRTNDLAIESDLIVYSDGPRSTKDAPKVGEVRSFLKGVNGFASVRVVERAANWGLANSVIDGVTETVRDRESVIVLEDDLLPSPFFLRYMNDGLTMYRRTEEVVSIHGYVYPVEEILAETSFLRGADCWGWATWRRGWDVFRPDGAALLADLRKGNLTDEFDFNESYPYTEMLDRQVRGEVDSWAIRWYASAFLKHKLTLYPGRSLVQNIGSDGSGTHQGGKDVSRVTLSTTPVTVHEIPVSESASTRKAFEKYFLASRPGLLRRSYGRLKHHITSLGGR